MSDQDLIFDVEHVTLRFGGVVSLNDVTLEMRRGEILAIIGPNGAGKTSLFNSLTGVYQPQEGVITFTGRNGRAMDIIGKKPFRVSAAGVARTFQASRMFAALTTFENVKIGAESHRGLGAVGAMLRGPRTRRDERESDAQTTSLLRFVGLARAGQRPVLVALLRRPAPPRDRPGPGDRPPGAAARRARGRDQPRREDPARRPHPQGARRDGRVDPADRARHEARHEPGRADLRAQLRRPHRRRHAAEIRANPVVVEAYLGSTDEERATG